MTFYGIRSFWNFCRGHWWGLFSPAVFFGAAIIPVTFVPYFLGQLTKLIASQDATGREIVAMACVMVGCGVVHQAFWLLGELLWRHGVMPRIPEYETHLYQQVAKQDYAYFVEKSTGKVAASISMVRDRINDINEMVYWGFIPQLVGLVATIFVMLSANWQSAVVYALAVVLITVAGVVLLKPATAAEAALTDVLADKSGLLIDSIGNFVSVKSFRTRWRETRIVEHKQREVLHKFRAQFTAWLIFWTALAMLIRFVTWPALVALNVWLFLQGDIGIASATTAITAGLVFTNTIWEVIWNFSQFSSLVSSIDESHTYLVGEKSLPDEPLDTTAPAVTVPHRAGMQLTNVTFAYPDKPERDVLHGIDLTIEPGERVGLVGASGSGKTTLVKLILGFYEPTAGSIAVSATEPSSDVKDICTYVPQDTAMFNRTVAENIAYAAAADTASQADIEQAAQRAYADEFIRGLPDGYDTLVGERGVKLSGGQRQRIAIARAILHDLPILILDEATSALDSDSERHVQEALDNLWQDRTVIAIAHRLSTLRSMHRIVVIDDGKIIEQGSHHTLLAAGGSYATLWQQQSDGFLGQGDTSHP